MKEILTEKSRNVFMEYFTINSKKFFSRRLLMALMIGLLYVMVLYGLNKLNNVWLLAGIILALYIGYKLPYVELIVKKDSDDLLKEYMFPNFLRYFVSLLNTQGNVYRTLKETSNYVHDPLKKPLLKLIKQLEENNTDSHDAFMEFAESIGTSEAMMIMNMIDEFNEHGINKNDIKELENIVIQLQENKTNELIDKKVGKMERHADPILLYTIGYIFAFVMISYMAYMQLIEI